MPRRVSVKSRVYKKANWSHENKGCLITTGTELVNGLFQGGSSVVPASNTQGTRTVGNFDITVPTPFNSSSGVSEVYYALVYCPQGETVKSLFASTGSPDGSLYEPNQYVLASGISDSTAGPIRIRSRMKRKLQSGDFISLVIGTTVQSSTTQTRALVSYSIKYN